jgi:putative two-component system response regulator
MQERLCWAVIGLAGGAIAATLPTPGADGPVEAVRWGGLVGAAIFACVVISIAWYAGEWTPVLMAAGCTWMATGMALQFVGEGLIAGIGPWEGAGFAGLWGMTAAGVPFAASTIGRHPVPAGERARPRMLLVGLVAFGAAVPAAVLAVPALEPASWWADIAAGVAVTGYLMAARNTFLVHRILRLPFSLAVGSASILFAILAVVMAAGGAGMPVALIEAGALLAGSLPIAGFVLEHRARPGLRTIVLGMSLPAVAARFERGDHSGLNRMLAMISDDDPGLGGHLSRVGLLASGFASVVDVDAETAKVVALAATAHDAGKLFVPRTILEKRGPLTERERHQVEKHAAAGARWLTRLPGMAKAARAAGEHHERWDGAGYPAGLTATDISTAGRMIAIADVFDALTSPRAYKPAWPEAEALEHISAGAGTQFDPELAAAFVAWRRRATAREEGIVPLHGRQRGQHVATRAA